MNLGDFEVGIDFTIDGNQVVFATEEVEEGTEVSVHVLERFSSVYLCGASVSLW